MVVSDFDSNMHIFCLESSDEKDGGDKKKKVHKEKKGFVDRVKRPRGRKRRKRRRKKGEGLTTTDEEESDIEVYY